MKSKSELIGLPDLLDIVKEEILPKEKEGEAEDEEDSVFQGTRLSL